MGSHPATFLTALVLLGPGLAGAQEPGWHYSPLPGEGDRASLGCDAAATPSKYTCLAVRCEDDYSVGVHIFASRQGGVDGPWEITLDRETRLLSADPSAAYGGRFADDDGWLLDGLRHGTFVYLRHEDDPEGGFAQISLMGSFTAIAEALRWCAPRVPGGEQNVPQDVENKQAVDNKSEEGEPG